MYNQLGAHPEIVDGVSGTRFAVWAPNATDVSVLCESNYWTPGQFRLQGSESGVWSGFMPAIGHGAAYKYGIRTHDGRVLEKSDPFAFYAETPPKTASIIYQLDGFKWRDESWLKERRQVNWLQKPMCVYEVHPASWKRPWDGRRYHSYLELAEHLVDYVREMGYTHIQLMPVTEHPFDGSWGYQTTGYYAPTSRYGTPHEFMYFVDYCHQHGIGVLIDWAPAHFPADAHGLAQFDGSCLFEHSDPRQGFHPDWRSCIFNYGRFEVRDFLINSARFWLDRYHVDGLRVDAAASMLYNDYSREHGEWVTNCFGGRENLEAIEFLKQLNICVHGEFPGILTIAEESTDWPAVSRPVYCGGLGFDMKWDMGWMNDTLRYFEREPVHRSHHHGELSFRMIYAFNENFMLPLSHDEVVHGKQALIAQMPGDDWQKFANLRLLYSYQYTTPGKKLLFMGGEFAQWSEWNAEDQLEWELAQYDRHDGIKRLVGDLNRVYRDQPALHENDCTPDGFSWIQCDDWQNSVYAFMRRAKDPSDFVVVIMNFTPVPREDYRIGVPEATEYIEILNSDASIYGGSNIGNLGRLTSETIPMHGYQQSVSLRLPPLSVVILTRCQVSANKRIADTPSEVKSRSIANQQVA